MRAGHAFNAFGETSYVSIFHNPVHCTLAQDDEEQLRISEEREKALQTQRLELERMVEENERAVKEVPPRVGETGRQKPRAALRNRIRRRNWQFRQTVKNTEKCSGHSSTKHLYVQ